MFFNESSVILLSVYIVAVHGLSSGFAKDTDSRAFTIAIFPPGCLRICCPLSVLSGLRVPYRRILQLRTQHLVHFCSHLCMPASCSSCSFASVILTDSAGCGQFFSYTSLSTNCAWLPIPFLMLCCMTHSSDLIIMEVMPVKMHNASLDVFRYALAIFMFMSRCTRLYF